MHTGRGEEELEREEGGAFSGEITSEDRARGLRALGAQVCTSIVRISGIGGRLTAAAMA